MIGIWWWRYGYLLECRKDCKGLSANLLLKCPQFFTNLYPGGPLRDLFSTQIDELAMHILVADTVRRNLAPVAITDRNGRAANKYRLNEFFYSKPSLYISIILDWDLTAITRALSPGTRVSGSAGRVCVFTCTRGSVNEASVEC